MMFLQLTAEFLDLWLKILLFCSLALLTCTMANRAHGNMH